MEIDVILILNLEHRPDRLWTTFGALVAGGAPVDIIHRWHATPGSDFKDLDALIRAATEDGFPQLSYLVINLPADSPDYQLELNIKTQAWNYCQMLRYLVETNQSGLILYDDRYVKDWGILSGMYKNLRRMQPDNPCLIVQLDHYFSLHFNQKMRPPTYRGVPYIRQGPISGSENAMLYSPAGAEWFLSETLVPENKNHNIEATIGRLSFLPREERPDFWSCDPDFDVVRTIPAMGSNINIHSDTPVLTMPTINK